MTGADCTTGYTQTIRLLPFTLAEADAYLKYRGVVLDHYQTLQLYMAMGGIPYYLQHISPGESAAQSIDRLCFTTNGPLRTEFGKSSNPCLPRRNNTRRSCGRWRKKAGGLTREEIIKEARFTTGGGMTKVLKELMESGFIAGYVPFGKGGNEIYKLSDEYSLFYQNSSNPPKRQVAGPGCDRRTPHRM